MPADTLDMAGRTMLLEQEYRYTYERPIRNLRHRLVAVPRERHGAQQRTRWDLTISGARARCREARDAFGNHLIEIDAEEVTNEITFTISSLVSWRTLDRTQPLDDAVADGLGELAAPSALTNGNAALLAASTELIGRSTSTADFAELACNWTARALIYEFGVTGVRTPAAAALEGGRGVCQDFAHVMLAICRAAAIPARYVSGHLVGEGGAHAWVEVFAEERWVAFDPTHARRTDHRYLTVAVGREYKDVAPTSGTFSAGGPGVLTTTKRLSILGPAS
jgi:transglutaminase-like putative cysteine protease